MIAIFHTNQLSDPGFFVEGPPAKKLIELHPAAAGRMGPGDSAAQLVPVQVLVKRWTFDAGDDGYTVILLLEV